MDMTDDEDGVYAMCREDLENKMRTPDFGRLDDSTRQRLRDKVIAMESSMGALGWSWAMDRLSEINDEVSRELIVSRRRDAENKMKRQERSEPDRNQDVSRPAGRLTNSQVLSTLNKMGELGFADAPPLKKLIKDFEGKVTKDRAESMSKGNENEMEEKARTAIGPARLTPTTEKRIPKTTRTEKLKILKKVRSLSQEGLRDREKNPQKLLDHAIACIRPNNPDEQPYNFAIEEMLRYNTLPTLAKEMRNSLPGDGKEVRIVRSFRNWTQAGMKDENKSPHKLLNDMVAHVLPRDANDEPFISAIEEVVRDNMLPTLSQEIRRIIHEDCRNARKNNEDEPEATIISLNSTIVRALTKIQDSAELSAAYERELLQCQLFHSCEQPKELRLQETPLTANQKNQSKEDVAGVESKDVSEDKNCRTSLDIRWGYYDWICYDNLNVRVPYSRKDVVKKKKDPLLDTPQSDSSCAEGHTPKSL